MITRTEKLDSCIVQVLSQSLADSSHVFGVRILDGSYNPIINCRTEADANYLVDAIVKYGI
jgi:hypothetical protein